MKYLLLTTLILLTSASHATNKGKEAPPPKLEQDITAIASVGDITNEQIINQQLDFYNKVKNYNEQLQSMQNISQQNCLPEPGYQELDGAAYSVTTIGGTIGHENLTHSTGLCGGIVHPFVSREAKAAFRTKARNLERQGSTSPLPYRSLALPIRTKIQSTRQFWVCLLMSQTPL